MKTYKVDLYEHFGIDREGAQAGILTIYLAQFPLSIPTTRRSPGILILPGGGYYCTAFREEEPIAFRFLTQGYHAFVLEYSCAPSKFPTALREACYAMRYLRENADELGLNPHMIAAIGFSAGGHLCGTLGTMYDAPEVSDIGDAQLLRPDALCLSYPVAISWGKTHEGSFKFLTDGDEALRKRLSLDALVREDMPPVFLWHTRNDDAVPVRNSLVLAQALDEKNVSFTMNIYARGPHGISTADTQVYTTQEMPVFSKNLLRWIDDTIAFFAEEGFCVTD